MSFSASITRDNQDQPLSMWTPSQFPMLVKVEPTIVIETCDKIDHIFATYFTSILHHFNNLKDDKPSLSFI